MAEEELELDVNQQKGSKTTTVLLIVLIVLVLVMGGVGAWLFLSKDDGESTAANDDAKKDLAPLSYLTLVPEFIVNFGPDSKVRYLQVDLQVATRDKTALQTVGTYRPVLRNDILVVLSGVTFDELKDRSGKEALQKKLLNTINKIVVSAGQAAAGGETSDENVSEDTTAQVNPDTPVKGPIENVYFTSFIMQ